MRELCPKVRKTDILHYQCPAYAGFNGLLTAIYFWNAFSKSDQGKTYYPDVSHLVKTPGLLEMAARLVLILSVDYGTSSVLPLLIFKTKDLDIHYDFLIKRLLIVLGVSALTLSPIENYMKLAFRKKQTDITNKSVKI